MKISHLASLALSAVLAACASAPMAPTGMVAGKFVQFDCNGGRFSARFAEDGQSIRVRGLHGAAELDRKSDAVFEGDGYQLVTSGANGLSLMHGGKSNGTNCKAA